jgi:hypothetical protein
MARRGAGGFADVVVGLGLPVVLLGITLYAIFLFSSSTETQNRAGWT